MLYEFNGNFKLFYIPFFFIRKERTTIEEQTIFVEYLLKLFVLHELVEAGYSDRRFKTFLIKLNLQVADNTVTNETIISMLKEHIENSKNFNRENVKETIIEYRKNSLVYLNEYLYARDKGKPTDILFMDRIDIEHIMPQSLKKNLSSTEFE
jgi:hypothetical protein